MACLRHVAHLRRSSRWDLSRRSNHYCQFVELSLHNVPRMARCYSVFSQLENWRKPAQRSQENNSSHLRYWSLLLKHSHPPPLLLKTQNNPNHGYWGRSRRYDLRMHGSGSRLIILWFVARFVECSDACSQFHENILNFHDHLLLLLLHASRNRRGSAHGVRDLADLDIPRRCYAFSRHNIPDLHFQDNQLEESSRSSVCENGAW